MPVRRTALRLARRAGRSGGRRIGLFRRGRLDGSRFDGGRTGGSRTGGSRAGDDRAGDDRAGRWCRRRGFGDGVGDSGDGSRGFMHGSLCTLCFVGCFVGLRGDRRRLGGNRLGRSGWRGLGRDRLGGRGSGSRSGFGWKLLDRGGLCRRGLGRAMLSRCDRGCLRGGLALGRCSFFPRRRGRPGCERDSRLGFGRPGFGRLGFRMRRPRGLLHGSGHRLGPRSRYGRSRGLFSGGGSGRGCLPAGRQTPFVCLLRYRRPSGCLHTRTLMSFTFAVSKTSALTGSAAAAEPVLQCGTDDRQRVSRRLN